MKQNSNSNCGSKNKPNSKSNYNSKMKQNSHSNCGSKNKPNSKSNYN